MDPKRKVIFLALTGSIIIMLIKFAAYFITSSNAILTDAAESIVNVVGGMFAYYSIYLSAQPRDRNHPYGHGKIEFFSVFVEGTLIAIAGIIIIVKSVYNLFYPYEVEYLIQGAILIGFTGIANFAIGMYLLQQSKTLNSIPLFADGKHLQTDAFSSVGLVAGLLLIHFTKINYLDSLLSIGLGIYIIYSGYKLLRKSVGGLMDESDFEVVERVLKILNQNRKEAWIDIHNLRTQRYGNELHIDCHLTLPYYFDLNKVHEEVSSVDKLINQYEDRTEFFIHADPCLPQCCHYCRMSNCMVRSEEKTSDYTWTMENVTLNQKHFTTHV